MFLGKTDNLQEKKRIEIKKHISIVTTVFFITMLLPLLLYFIFYFNIVPSKSAFEGDIQEPVAKVVTSSGVGTAFLISPTILLTARHVVENNKVGDEVELFFEQSKNKLTVKAKIKYIAPSTVQSINGEVPLDYFLTDIAVLEVSEINDIQPLILGESEAVSNLDDVILIGYPSGDYSISKGNINSDKFQGFNLFKLDATSNPGNSGGPCILKNENTVIGILVGGSGAEFQGENVALKIDDIKRILDNAKINY
jgi:V8-like Glu-specific endopeptidase